MEYVVRVGRWVVLPGAMLLVGTLSTAVAGTVPSIAPPAGQESLVNPPSGAKVLDDQMAVTPEAPTVGQLLGRASIAGSTKSRGGPNLATDVNAGLVPFTAPDSVQSALAAGGFEWESSDIGHLGKLRTRHAEIAADRKRISGLGLHDVGAAPGESTFSAEGADNDSLGGVLQMALTQVTSGILAAPLLSSIALAVIAAGIATATVVHRRRRLALAPSLA